MNKKYNKDIMKESLIFSSLLKSVLFLFFAILLSISVKAQNCQILDSAIVINDSCYGAGQASIQLVLLDPLGSYSYNWSNGSTDQELVLVTAGTYTLQITDINNPSCVQDTLFTITQPQDPLSSTVNLNQHVICYGDSTGAAYVNVIGGTLPYTYLWSNGQTTQQATGLWGDPVGQGVPFFHTVTITDSWGCILNDGIGIINLHDSIDGTIDIIQNVSCFNACDGIVELSSSGGVLQHIYFWDNGQTYSGSGPDTTFNLCYGGHSVIIEDAEGCRKTVPFIISQPNELFAQAIQVQPVQCYGFDDGIAFASATGGTTPYTFAWDSINGPTGPNIDSLIPGIHTVYVTDANGCMASDTVVITEPTQLDVIIIDTMTIYSYCAGTNSGQLCAIASGGTPNYNYVWNDALVQTTTCAFNIPARSANYTVIVMDERNCIDSASFKLDSITNSMNSDSVRLAVNHVSCFNLYDGSISVSNVVGGVGPYTYNWVGPITPPSVTPYTGTGTNISSLYDGNYALVIEDVNGCDIVMDVQVLEPDELKYTTYNVIGETCYGANDGQIWVNVTGGTGNYYYDSLEVGIFPIPSLNQTQLINDSLIFNLSQGLHSIYITDDNDCEGAVVWGGNWQEQVDSGIVVTVPGVLTSEPSCFNTNDGQAWIQWPGANPLFNYTWETINNPSVILDTGSYTSILFPGNYHLVAHYANATSFGQNYVGCDSVVPFTISSPPPLLSGASVQDENCFGTNDGRITLSPSSSALGTPTVFWDTTTSIPIGSPLLTALDVFPLEPGVYTATITDANGCQITEPYTVSEALLMTASLSFIPPSCNGLTDGSATINASGGTGTWNISWTYSGGSAGSGTVINSIGAGIYTANAVDMNGCLASFSVIVTEPDDIIASVESSKFYNENQAGIPYNISCKGYSDGEVTVTNGGGVPPYSYSWIPAPTGLNGQLATGLSAGLNTVTVTDANGCTQSATITLVEPDYLNPNIIESYYSTSTNGVTNEIECHNWNNGWIESETFGGVPNLGYQYEWVNDNTGQIVSFDALAANLTANTSYTVTVIDANGCISDATSSVLDQPDPFVANLVTTNYGGPTHANFSVNFIDNTTSIDPYNFNWYLADGTTKPYSAGTVSMDLEFTVENIGQNNVHVILTNLETGCVAVDSFIIDVQGIPEIDNVFTPNGDNINEEFSFGEYGMSKIDVTIYNRWGQLVSSWGGMNKSWDGKGVDGENLPEGVYFYVLIAEGEDGYYYDYKGSITLLR